MWRQLSIYLLSLLLFTRIIYTFFTVRLYVETAQHSFMRLSPFAHQQVCFESVNMFLLLCFSISTVWLSIARQPLACVQSARIMKYLAASQSFALFTAFSMNALWIFLSDFIFPTLTLQLLNISVQLLFIVSMSFMPDEAMVTPGFKQADTISAKSLEFILAVAASIMGTALSIPFYSPVMDLHSPWFFIIDIMLWSFLLIYVLTVISMGRQSLYISLSDTIDSPSPTPTPTPTPTSSNYVPDTRRTTRRNISNPASWTKARIKTTCRKLGRFTRNTICRNLFTVYLPAYLCLKCFFFFRWSSAFFINDYANSISVFIILSSVSILLSGARFISFVSSSISGGGGGFWKNVGMCCRRSSTSDSTSDSYSEAAGRVESSKNGVAGSTTTSSPNAVNDDGYRGGEDDQSSRPLLIRNNQQSSCTSVDGTGLSISSDTVATASLLSVFRASSTATTTKRNLRY